MDALIAQVAEIVTNSDLQQLIAFVTVIGGLFILYRVRSENTTVSTAHQMALNSHDMAVTQTAGLQKANEQMLVLTAEVGKLRGKVERIPDLEDEMEAIRRKLDAATTSGLEKDKTIKTLQEEKEALLTQLGEMKTQLASLDGVNEQVSQMQQQIDDMSEQIRQLGEDVEREQKARLAAEKRADASEQRAVKAEDENARLRESLASMRKQVNKLQQQVDEVRSTTKEVPAITEEMLAKDKEENHS